MITNKNYNVDLASLADKKLMYDFAKKMHFDVGCIGNKSTRGRTLIKILKSQPILASWVSTIFSPFNPDELSERLKILLQKKQTGKNSDIINEKIMVIVGKLLEYKCITNKQHKQILFKYNLLYI